MLTTALIFLLLLESLGSLGVANAARECEPPFKEFKWQRLNVSQRLGVGDAIFTCRRSIVKVRSTLPFQSDVVEWRDEGRTHVGIIPSDTLQVLIDESIKGRGADIKIEVIEIVGQAFYSMRKKLIKKYEINAVLQIPDTSEAMERYLRRQETDLTAISWEPLGLRPVLEEWDMIWTRSDGRVEVEILQYGSGGTAYLDPSITVKDAQGRFTAKYRFPPNSFFIMEPHLFQKAKVNKVIGDVRIAKDRERARKFFIRYQTHQRVNLETAVPWEEILKKPELE